MSVDRQEAKSETGLASDLGALLLETAPIAVVVLDLKGRVERVNAFFERLTGFRAEEVRGQDWFSTFLPERERERVRSVFGAAVSGAPTRGNINAILTKTGEERLVEWNDEVIRDGEGKAAGLLAVGVDVTARVRAEEATRESHRRTKDILDGIFAFVGLFDVDGTVVETNRIPLDATGLTRDQLVGHKVWDTPLWAYSEASQQQARRAVARAAAGETLREDFVIKLVEGVFITLDVMVGPLRDASGRIAHLIASGVDVTEHRRIADEAIAARATLTEAQRIAQIGSWDLDLVSGRLAWSMEIYRIFEIDPTRFGASYEAFLDAIHPDDRAAVNDAYTSSVAKREPYAITHRLRMSDGRIKIVHERCETTYAPDGTPLRSVGTVQDITRQSAIEEALRESEERYHSVVAALTEGVVLQGKDGAIRAFNASAERILGLSPEALAGRTSHDPQWHAVHEDGTPFPGESHPAMVTLRTGRPISDAIMGIVAPDGGRRWLSINSQPVIRSGESEPSAVVTSFSDVTERKTTESALRLLSTDLAHLGGASLFREVALQLARLLGVEVGFVSRLASRETARLRTLAFTLDGVPLPDVEYDVADTPCEVVLRERCAVLLDDVARRFPKDRMLVDLGIASYAGVPMVDAKGNPIGHIGVMSRKAFCNPAQVQSMLQLFAVRTGAEVDREERARVEGQLREARKMEALGTLAGGIAHDFNNLLAVVTANAEVARGELASEHPAGGPLEDIQIAAARGTELVRQILAFSRKQPRDPVIVELGPLLEESARMLRASLPAGIDLEVRADAGAPVVLADEVQIQRVLLDLGANARDALEGRTGRITFALDGFVLEATAQRPHSALEPGLYARVVVSDSGRGMDGATLERIFEPFFTTKPVGKGSGLGLAVVHGVVQAHGGVVDVESEPEQGTRFYVYLPAASDVGAGREVAAAPAAAAAPSAADGARVLFVDDEPSLVSLAKRLLERRGHRVTGFTGARDALDALRRDPRAFDVVVVDFKMPETSGLDVAREVRRLRPDLPVVLMSGHLPERARAEIVEAGVHRVLDKPTRADDLAAVIREVVGGRGAALGSSS